MPRENERAEPTGGNGRVTLSVPGFDASSRETAVAPPPDSAEAIFRANAEARAARNGNRQPVEEPETPEVIDTEPEVRHRGEPEERSATPDTATPEERPAPETDEHGQPTAEAARATAPAAKPKPARPAQPRLTRAQQAALAQLADIQQAASADPEIAVRYHKFLVANGKPVPPDLASYVYRLQSGAAPAAQQPVAPPPAQQLTKEQITARFREIMKSGDIEGAYEFKADQMFGLELKRLRAELEAGKADRQSREQQAAQAEFQRKTNEGFKELAKVYTDFFEVREDGTAWFNGSEEATTLYDKMVELDADYQNSLPVVRLAKLAMDELGWLARNPANAQPQPQPRQQQRPGAVAGAGRPRSQQQQEQPRGRNGQFRGGLWNIRIPVFEGAQRRR